MENAWLSTIERQAFFLFGRGRGGWRNVRLESDARDESDDGGEREGLGRKTDDGLMHDGRWAGARDVTGNKAEKLHFCRIR